MTTTPTPDELTLDALRGLDAGELERLRADYRRRARGERSGLRRPALRLAAVEGLLRLPLAGRAGRREERDRLRAEVRAAWGRIVRLEWGAAATEECLEDRRALARRWLTTGGTPESCRN